MFNLLALLLPLILLLLWWMIGYAVLSTCYSQRYLMRNMLCAPSVGLAVTVVLLFLGSVSGWAIKSFAALLLILLFAVSLSALIYQKPKIPWRSTGPFLLLVIAALLLTGSPLLHYGFNWLSYGNDDMANYCLLAQRLFDHGYLARPDVVTMLSGKDNSAYYWILHIFGERLGSELLLAWLSAITTLSAPQLFMPLIIALHLSLLTATAGLVYINKQWRFAALATLLLLACSALANLGVFYQLVAQVGGMSLFIVCCVLFPKLLTIKTWRQSVQYASLIAITLAALLIFYEEIVLFLLIPYFIYLISYLSRHKIEHVKFWLTGLLIALLVFLLLGKYFWNTLGYQVVLAKLSMVADKKNNGIFPYFLQASGLSYLWGLSSIPLAATTLVDQVKNIIGGGLLIACTGVALMLLRSLIFLAITLLVMLLVGVYFYIDYDGFSLFKLAMYIQPLLLASYVIGTNYLFKQPWPRFFSLFALAIVELHSQHFYWQRSQGSVGAFVEIPGASQTQLLAELKQQTQQIPANVSVLLTTTNQVEQKLLMYYLQGKPTFSISLTPLLTLVQAVFATRAHNPLTPLLFGDSYQYALKYRAAVQQDYHQFTFNLPGLAATQHITFWQQKFNVHGQSIYIFDTAKLAIFNRRYFSSYEQNVTAIAAGDVKNKLVFINSNLGQNYYFGQPGLITLFPLQEDYFYPHQTGAGVGRYLLLRLLNPSPSVRIIINLSTLNNRVDYRKIPNLHVIGKTQQPLPVLGSGSARLLSPVLQPQIIQGKPYVLLVADGNDQTLAVDGKVMFVRDISLISEADYRRLQWPFSISKFPADLANPNLFYSGIYEDGWVAADSYVDLSKPQTASNLVVRGTIPEFVKQDYQTVLSIIVNNKEIYHQKLGRGDFTLTLPAVDLAKQQSIQLHFSRVFALPKGDDRSCAAQLKFIGFLSDF